MTPDQSEKQFTPSERHRRSRSSSMKAQDEVIEVTDDSDDGIVTSRKHVRNDQDTHVEGPSKRPKVETNEEPLMSKDKRITPKAKRKKKRKEVNHRKAPRTSNHQKLKEDIRALKRELEDAKQRHHDTEHKLKEKIKSLENDLTNSQPSHRATQQEPQDLKQKSSEKIGHLERRLENFREAHDGTKTDIASANEQLKDQDVSLQSIFSELEEAKRSGAPQFEEARKKKLTIKTEREEPQHLKAQVNDPVNGLQALHQSCQEKDDELKIKNERIYALQKRLDDSTAQCAGLEKAIAETRAAHKTAKSNQDNFRDELVKTTERLKSAERDRDEAKTAREKAEKDAEALHRVNEASGHRAHGARTREQKAKDTLKSVRSEKAALEDRCKEMQTNMKDQESVHNQMVASLHQKLMASRNQSQRYNYKEPDDKIKKDFASLEARVRHFVNGCTKPVLAALDQDLQRLWPNWSPGLRDFLASPMLCNLVFEAYVWDYLVTRIFSRESQIWTGELGQSLDMTLRLAGGEADAVGYNNDLYIDYQYFRSSSSSLIHRLNGQDFLPKYFKSDAEAITSNLAKLCGYEITETMKADAMEVFKEAREFEIQLRMLKAVYDFVMCKVVVGVEKVEKLKHGFEFMDDQMVNRSPKQSGKDSEQTTSVDFITCPGIYKRGNNNGAHYETKTCLIKMGVVCNAKELSKPDFSTPSQPSSTQAQESTHSNEAKAEAGRAKNAQPTANPVNHEDDPSMASNTKTRSRGLSKTNNTATGDKSSTPSTPNTRGSTRGCKGRGAGKRTRSTKDDDPDGEFNPT